MTQEQKHTPKMSKETNDKGYGSDWVVRSFYETLDVTIKDTAIPLDAKGDHPPVGLSDIMKTLEAQAPMGPPALLAERDRLKMALERIAYDAACYRGDETAEQLRSFLNDCQEITKAAIAKAEKS